MHHVSRSNQGHSLPKDAQDGRRHFRGAIAKTTRTQMSTRPETTVGTKAVLPVNTKIPRAGRTPGGEVPTSDEVTGILEPFGGHSESAGRGTSAPNSPARSVILVLSFWPSR